MEEDTIAARDGDPRPYAPDQYTIHLNPNVYDHLMARQPALAQILSQHLVELAATVGYRLSDSPSIEIIPEPTIEPNQLFVDARHAAGAIPSTAFMKRIDIPVTHAPQNPQLIINAKTISQDSIIYIWRAA